MMKRTTMDGKTVNQRTYDMVKLWEFNCLEDLFVIQGSYNAGGVSASAGTHDGGGAVDITVKDLGSLSAKRWRVKQGRLAGFAAWYRPTISGLWSEHIHAIAIGDPEMSSGARNQVSAYYDGRDGLASNLRDQDLRVSPIPVYPKVPLKKVSLLTAYWQFKTSKPASRYAVRRIQWVLNERINAGLICDGVAGPKTRSAYKRWEARIGAPAADGIPGKYSLSRLGQGRFKMSIVDYEKWLASK